MNSTIRIDRNRHYLVFFFLVLFCFVIYWPGLIALPRSDHSLILDERQFYDNDIDFFINLLSFSRTRHIAPGDVFLFRPGTTGVLAVLDIYLRPNLYLLGALSILWHAIAVFSAYLIFQRLKVGALATYSLLAILLVQYPGMDMILWRHVSPYIFALVFFSLGLFVLLRTEHRGLKLKDSILVSSMFFFSMLFHELLVLALPFAFLLTVFTPLRKWLGLGHRSIILLMPSVCYMVVNVADYYLYGALDVVGPADIRFELKLVDFISVFGIFFYQFLFPFLVEIEHLRSRTIWPLNNTFGAGFLFPGLGLMLLTLFGAIVLGLRNALNHRSGEFSTLQNELRCFLIVIVLSVLVSLFGGLLVGRIALRGMAYLVNSTYNFYFFNFLFVLMTGLIFSIFRPWIENNIQEYNHRISLYNKSWLDEINSKYLIVIIISSSSFILADLMVMNQAIQGASLKEDEVMAKVTLWVSDVSKQREYCYAGSEVGIVPDVLLYRESCQVKNGIPVVLRQGTYLSLYLVAKNSGAVISTYHLNISDINAQTHALSEVEQKLIGEWKGNNGRRTYIILGADNVITAVNEDGARDQLKIEGKLIIPTLWNVQPNLSDDGKLLNWGNGTVWTR